MATAEALARRMPEPEQVEPAAVGLEGAIAQVERRLGRHGRVTLVRLRQDDWLCSCLAHRGRLVETASGDTPETAVRALLAALA